MINLNNYNIDKRVDIVANPLNPKKENPLKWKVRSKEISMKILMKQLKTWSFK